MPYISTFMYSEFFNIVPSNMGSNIEIINPRNTFALHNTPCNLNFAITFGIVELHKHEKNTIRYIFSGPQEDMPTLLDTGVIELPSEPNQLKKPGDMSELMMGMNFESVYFPCAGTYKSELYINGMLLGIFPINVHDHSNG